MTPKRYAHTAAPGDRIRLSGTDEMGEVVYVDRITGMLHANMDVGGRSVGLKPGEYQFVGHADRGDPAR